jgi:hypothetical protein
LDTQSNRVQCPQIDSYTNSGLNLHWLYIQCCKMGNPDWNVPPPLVVLNLKNKKIQEKQEKINIIYQII